MFKVNKKKHQNDAIGRRRSLAIGVVQVSLLLTLNIFHTLLVFLLLTLSR